MALENGYTFAPRPMTAPKDTPYQTPFKGTWQESAHHELSSPFPSSSPPTSPPREQLRFRESYKGGDINREEEISALDPRRFTPNLHASLVSEILSLRRDIESKDGVVENLEEDLQNTRQDNEQLNDTIKNQTKDSRSAQKHMDLLESGTLSALEDIAKDRDGAVENLVDTRRRLEISQSKIRVLEEMAKKSHAIWDQDRQNWDVERRILERKVHVGEGRLKTMITEVAAVQAKGQYPSGADDDVEDDVQEMLVSRWSDTISIRSNSVKGRSRFSVMSSNNYDGNEVPAVGPPTKRSSQRSGNEKVNGLSLAEELEFDEEDEVEEVEEVESGLDNDHTSPDALSEESAFSHRVSLDQSRPQDHKARRLLGLSEGRIGEALREKPMGVLIENLAVSVEKGTLKYKDTATQFSPPPSPRGPTQLAELSLDKQTEQIEHTANQRRKRVSIPAVFMEQTIAAKIEAPVVMPMVSAACQTEPQLPSSPLTLASRIDVESFPTPPALTNRSASMESSSTQTDHDDVPALQPARSRAYSKVIPVIAIHPPRSRPQSSHNGVVLPPRTKNVACQASIEIPIDSKSVSVQTELQVNEHASIFVPRLLQSHGTFEHPSEFQSRAAGRVKPRIEIPRRRITRRNLQRPPPVEPPPSRVRTPTSNAQDAYPGNNDNGPLEQSQRSDLRRPVRTGSLFAGFDVQSEEDAAKEEIDFSDDDFATAEPIRKTLTKVKNSWKVIPQAEDTLAGRLETAHHDTIHELGRDPRMATSSPESKTIKRPLAAKPSPLQIPARPSIPNIAAKPNDGKQTALMSRSSHTQRSKSPRGPGGSSEKFATTAPPFPVPTRSSSRRIHISASDGARSPTPYSTNFFSSHPKHFIKNPLRKVQSAAAVSKLTRNYGRRSSSRSPPPMSPSSPGFDSPKLPGRPRNGIASQPAGGAHQIPHSSHASSSVSIVSRTPVESPGRPISVVDAIAQTMVGEWMWKYVRKRKSFGIAESPAVEFEAGKNNAENGGSHGNRHRRWVWLAPYERAVIWSSKQPTTGHALMGKSGRKLTIKAVLDVKDDTPLPKNAGAQPVFDRSILVLTPQRALKFTASTRERHLVWLAALSFLSHSSSGMDGGIPIVPVPQQEYQPPALGMSGGLRRAPIRDSIRVAKGKTRPALIGHSYTSPASNFQGQALQSKPYSNNDPESDAAEPPHVPRIATHSRKRSNTGPRPTPPSAFRSHSAQTSTLSLNKVPTRDAYAFPRANPAPISRQSSMSYRTRDANIAPLPIIRNNFFDAVGTIRMEAFVDVQNGRKENAAAGHMQARKEDRRSYRTRLGRKKDMSYWGVGVATGSGGTMHGGESKYRGEDPFKEF